MFSNLALEAGPIDDIIISSENKTTLETFSPIFEPNLTSSPVKRPRLLCGYGTGHVGNVNENPPTKQVSLCYVKLI